MKEEEEEEEKKKRKKNRKRKERNNRSSSCRPQQSRTKGYNKWLITNLGTASRKEHKYSSFCRSSQRWTMKQFFHLLDLTVLNSWILLSSCGGFRLLLVRNLTEGVGKSQDHPIARLAVRPSVGAKIVLRVELLSVCLSRPKKNSTVYKCTRCDVGLFEVHCLVEYHTGVNL